MKKEEGLNLFDTIDKIRGVGQRYLRILNKRDIKTVSDILQIFPVYYIDFSRPETGFLDYNGVYETKILSIKAGRNFRRRLSLLRVDSLTMNKKVEIVFFNKTYIP